MVISMHYLMWSMYETRNVKIDITPNLIIFYKPMARSREYSKEYARDYSTEWIELLVILIILTVLGVAMYFSFRSDPNHSITETSKNKAVVDEKSPIKAMQTERTVHMVSVESVPITKVPIKTVPIKVVESYASKIRTLDLTPVRDKQKVELTQVRVPRIIRRIPETK